MAGLAIGVGGKPLDLERATVPEFFHTIVEGETILVAGWLGLDFCFALVGEFQGYGDEVELSERGGLAGYVQVEGGFIRAFPPEAKDGPRSASQRGENDDDIIDDIRQLFPLSHSHNCLSIVCRSGSRDFFPAVGSVCVPVFRHISERGGSVLLRNCED